MFDLGHDGVHFCSFDEVYVLAGVAFFVVFF